LFLVGYVEGDRQQVGPITEAILYGLGIAGGCDDRVAGRERLLGDQRAEAARCTGDEPNTPMISPFGSKRWLKSALSRRRRHALPEIVEYDAVEDALTILSSRRSRNHA
jgi:hypothetical protein